jgi:hypothetical protein
MNPMRGLPNQPTSTAYTANPEPADTASRPPYTPKTRSADPEQAEGAQIQAERSDRSHLTRTRAKALTRTRPAAYRKAQQNPEPAEAANTPARRRRDQEASRAAQARIEPLTSNDHSTRTFHYTRTDTAPATTRRVT